MLDDLTALIITFNEEANIARTLDRLTWMRRIVVIDSGSTDGTLGILARYPQVRVIERAFDDFASQCNFGLQQIDTPWVLSLDADYELSGALADELQHLTAEAAISGYRASFIYRMNGKPLRGTLYPPRTVLYRKDKAFYRREAHGHRVAIDGEVRRLSGPIYVRKRSTALPPTVLQRRCLREAPSAHLSPDQRQLSDLLLPQRCAVLYGVFRMSAIKNLKLRPMLGMDNIFLADIQLVGAFVFVPTATFFFRGRRETRDEMWHRQTGDLAVSSGFSPAWRVVLEYIRSVWLKRGLRIRERLLMTDDVVWSLIMRDHENLKRESKPLHWILHSTNRIIAPFRRRPVPW